MAPAVPVSMERRRVLGWMVAAVAVAATGCAPARLLLRTDRPRPENGATGAEATLRAFALTIVPGVDPAAPDLARVYRDPSYPLARFRSFLVADLDRRAGRLVGRPFALLAPRNRHAVVLSGVRAHGVTGRLYTGAVYLTQVALYAGIYDDAAGSPLIDFPGAGHLVSDEERTWPATEALFRPGPARAGNPL